MKPYFPLYLPLVLMMVMIFTLGCGNVTLKGDAMIAAQTSTLDACGAVNRATLDPNESPWVRAYLAENFKQWRSFVRSANKDSNWGPKLVGE